MFIYHHTALDGNKLVQLRGLTMELLRRANVQADLNTLTQMPVAKAWPSHMKHM
jgi:hypothetical protein